MTNPTQSPAPSTPGGVETVAMFNPFDYVESCEPDCGAERHAYHQGQWDMAMRINAAMGAISSKLEDPLAAARSQALAEGEERGRKDQLLCFQTWLGAHQYRSTFNEIWEEVKRELADLTASQRKESNE